jgi:hypothetical protein
MYGTIFSDTVLNKCEWNTILLYQLNISSAQRKNPAHLHTHFSQKDLFPANIRKLGSVNVVKLEEWGQIFLKEKNMKLKWQRWSRAYHQRQGSEDTKKCPSYLQYSVLYHIFFQPIVPFSPFHKNKKPALNSNILEP